MWWNVSGEFGDNLPWPPPEVPEPALNLQSRHTGELPCDEPWLKAWGVGMTLESVRIPPSAGPTKPRVVMLTPMHVWRGKVTVDGVPRHMANVGGRATAEDGSFERALHERSHNAILVRAPGAVPLLVGGISERSAPETIDLESMGPTSIDDVDMFGVGIEVGPQEQIVSVMPRGPADGILRAGDVLVEVDGIELAAFGSPVPLLLGWRSDQVTVTVQRERTWVTVTLRRRRMRVGARGDLGQFCEARPAPGPHGTRVPGDATVAGGLQS